MDSRLMNKCELLADNRDLLNKNFKWDYEMLIMVGSVIFTDAGKTVDIDRVNECKAILKKHEGVFSYFRNNMEKAVLAKMALSDDPEKYLTDVVAIYDKLHKGKIAGSDYMALTAMNICDSNKAADTDAIIEKTKLLLKEMNKKHPILTSDEDMTFAAMLAMTDKDVDAIVNEAETYYEALKPRFSFHTNSLQSLSHVLILMEGSVESKIAKVCEIYDTFKEQGVKYGKDYVMASIGALVNTNISTTELVSEIIEASEYLKTRKGFGAWGIGEKARLMFASLLAADVYGNDKDTMNSAVITGSIAMVIAEEIAIMAVIAASAASSANS